ncbi:MAG: DUF11 domain-containing protein [Fibrobacter sp.]|nr:DUF11 domain-containing protein [Fibrobacter sp.]
MNNIRQAGEMITQKRGLYQRYSIVIQSVMLICQLGCFSQLFAQTEALPRPIAINSGNPKYPFPQFLPYKNPTSTLSNLGVRSGVGVTHAEMEQAIRDAYQIMMNRTVRPGGSVGGKPYIKYRSSPQCSEGDGYGLLGAAAMADKETFDGMWLYIHDFNLNKVKRYRDGTETSPGYAYSQLVGWQGEGEGANGAAGANSAADGDVDIGLALLTAYYQWGEFMGINDASGEPISYKKEAINFLKALTDTLKYNVNDNLVCGDIGLDGYIKGGDSWTELTDWASDKSVSGFAQIPEHKGPSAQHIDYAAPSYFRAFANFLEREDAEKYAWNIYQFRRAEASSDWLMGQMLKDEKMIPFAGWVKLSKDNVPTFTNFSDGEDFRCAWRTILNAMWYGNPESTWDPVTHQVKQGVPNSYESDLGKRYARFLWDSRQAPWNAPCIINLGGDKNTTYWGPETVKYYYTPTGEPLGTFPLNWVPGTGSPSAVISQDQDLMAELYRKLEVTWDGDEGDDRYLKSVPFYFHGWFRLFGLLTLTGNYQALDEIKATANMKVYCAINKTFGFEGDSVVYTFDYRNYGSLDAEDVKIVDTLHKDFTYVGSTGGGVYNSASHTVTWNIGSVDGFQSSTGIDPTKGQVTLTVKVENATVKQYRNSATISCSNGSGWTSDEYPNNITAVMERNYLDIAKRALVIDKKASNTMVNPGKELTFSIDFENTSEAGWINGGRSGVNFSYSHKTAGGSAPVSNMRFKLFHDADEAYIDYGNYRVSYFMFDPGLQCYQDASSCQTGWKLSPTIVEGIEKDAVKVLHENIMAGSDANGKWNQRIIVQFSDPTDPNRVENLVTTNYHLDWYRGVTGMIHRGGTSVLRVVWDLNSSNYQDVDWSDDWSWDADATDLEDGKYWPITNDWTDLDNPDIPVTTWNPKQCDDASHVVDNILVEEWDGYTWRRVAGNGPLPGRDVANVVIKDTIPDGLVFSRFTGDAPLGVSAKIDGQVITWTIPKMQIKEKGSLKYVVTAAGNCPMQNKSIVARSWLSADKESAISDSTIITVTCDSVPPPPPEPTTMYKLSDKPVYRQGDTVNYKINYKQTHGTIITDATDADEWVDKSGNGKFSFNGDTIVYDQQNTVMVHKYAFGKNGVFGGTIDLTYYDSSSLAVRVNDDDKIEIRMFKDYADIRMSFFSNGKQIGGNQRLQYRTYPAPFNFKVRLSEDTVQFWGGDTAGFLPGVSQDGFPVREGYAGVMSLGASKTKVWGWNSHMDAAFDVSIHDKLPSNLTYRSAGGTIVTGTNKGKTVTANNVNGDIQWNIISGDTPLSANDSISLWIKTTLDNCTGDTIRNTAFTNIRGWPDDNIGAMNSIVCTTEDDLKPDHIDIIIDTTSFNRTNDEYLDPITLGANQSTYVLYAVIRDKYGNFLSYADNAQWSSSNTDVVTIKGGSSKWIGTITNIGAGSSTITVSDNSISSSDTIDVTVLKTAAWPSIRSAVMLDSNGDLVPDQMDIVLTSDFESDQRLDSISIDYKGIIYTAKAQAIDVDGVDLSFQFTSRSGKDGTPTGRVIAYMTVDGDVKSNTKSFSDGVGPSLISAFVEENDADVPDVLILTFSEAVVPTTVMGNQLLLIKGGDTTKLSVDKIVSLESDSQYTVQLTKSSKRPLDGDKLRLTPGNAGGTVSDMNTNLPHKNNEPVVISLRKGPAGVESAIYLDANADGYIDSVRVKFKRAVTLDEIDSMIAVLYLQNKTSNIVVDKNKMTLINDSLVGFGLNVRSVQDEVNTSMMIELKIVSILAPTKPVTPKVSDKAAPVIASAKLLPGENLDDGSGRLSDTLFVEMSEKVSEPLGSDPFNFISASDGTRYSLRLRMVGSDNATYRFIVENNSDIMINSGDSIWINSVAKLSDLNGAVQDNIKNRRVALSIVWPPAKWKVVIGPNPFKPGESVVPENIPDRGKGFGTVIKVKPTSSVDIDNVNVTCKIFDLFGNVLYEKKFSQRGDSYYAVWDGSNKNSRTVGTGTYKLVVVCDDGTNKVVETRNIAVKR